MLAQQSCPALQRLQLCPDHFSCPPSAAHANQSALCQLKHLTQQLVLWRHLLARHCLCCHAGWQLPTKLLQQVLVKLGQLAEQGQRGCLPQRQGCWVTGPCCAYDLAWHRQRHLTLLQGREIIRKQEEAKSTSSGSITGACVPRSSPVR